MYFLCRNIEFAETKNNFELLNYFAFLKNLEIMKFNKSTIFEEITNKIPSTGKIFKRFIPVNENPLVSFYEQQSHFP